MSEEATYNPDNPTGIYDPSQYSTAIQQHGIDIFGSGAAHGKAFKQSTDDIKNAGLRTGVTKDYYGNALPATAYEYVMQQLDAARKRGNVTTNTLRAIESGAKAYYTVDKGWDISGSMSADFNMANAINKMGSGTRQAGTGSNTNTTNTTNTTSTTTNTTNTNTSGATGGGGGNVGGSTGGVASKSAQQPTTTTPTNTPKEGWDYWINKATQAAKDYPYGVISWLQKHGSEYPAGLISVIQKRLNNSADTTKNKTESQPAAKPYSNEWLLATSSGSGSDPEGNMLPNNTQQTNAERVAKLGPGSATQDKARSEAIAAQKKAEEQAKQKKIEGIKKRINAGVANTNDYEYLYTLANEYSPNNETWAKKYISELLGGGGSHIDQIYKLGKDSVTQRNQDSLNKSAGTSTADTQRQQAVQKAQAQQKSVQYTKDQIKGGLDTVRNTYKSIKRDPKTGAPVAKSITQGQKDAAKILWHSALKGTTDASTAITNLRNAKLTQDEILLVQFIATKM